MGPDNAGEKEPDRLPRGAETDGASRRARMPKYRRKALGVLAFGLIFLVGWLTDRLGTAIVVVVVSGVMKWLDDSHIFRDPPK